MCAQGTHSGPEPRSKERSGPEWDRWSIGTVLIGVALAIIHAIHVNEMLDYGLVGVIVEGVVPFVFAGLLALSGPWLSYLEYSSDERRQVFKWMVVIGLLVGLLFVWALSHQYLLYQPFPHAEYVTTTNVTAGGLLGIVIGLYDVKTQRHHRLAQQEQEISDLQRSRLSVLNRVLRHNIRNDMNIVQGICTDIANESTGEAANRASIAADVVADLHQMSEKARRIDETLAADRSLDEEVDLQQLLQEAVSRYEQSVDTVTYELDISEELPLLSSNKQLLSDVIDELLENTAEHGGDELTSVTLTAEATDGDWVDLQISDNGPGLPRIEHESLQFGVERDIEHMSGIGLWFAKWGTEMLDGAFQIESGPETGTIVDLRLPVSKAT